MIVRNTEILLDLSQGVSDPHHFRKLTDAIYQVTAHQLRFTRMNIVVFDAEQGYWRGVARRGQDGRPVTARFERGRLTQRILELAARHAHRAKVVEDYTTDPDAEALPRFSTEGLRSGIHVFLRRSGKFVGVFSVQHSERDFYTPSDARFLFEVGQTVATALENIGDYREAVEERDLTGRSKRSRRITDEECGIIGSSPAVQHLREMIHRVAATDATVLLLGETGTGKAMAAQAIHTESRRRNKCFLTVNCAGLTPELVSSELFGHEAGAFTGATRRHRGRFELADGGTLFLDEIGDIGLDTQVRLLRVLEEGEFERVGGIKSLKTDVRIIAATHRNLDEMVERGQFRADLYFRLNAFPIHVPPLRDRGEDIIELAIYFARRNAERANKPPPTIDEEVSHAFKRYPWSGNIRELRNVIERAMILCDRDRIELRQLPLHVAYGDAHSRLRETIERGFSESPRTRRSMMNGATLITDEGDVQILPLSDAIRRHILKALRQCGGKISGKGGAAQLLEVNPKTLESKMRKLGIRRQWE